MSRTFETPIWTRRIADEFWSGTVTPLTYSLLGDTMVEHMVRRALRQARLDELADAPVLRRHASHVYVNGSLLAAVVSLLPPTLRSAGLLQLLPSEVRDRVAPTSTLAATLRTGGIIARFLLREPAWSPWQRAGAFERACGAIRVRFTTASPLAAGAGTTAAVLAEIETVRADLGAYLETVSWGVVFAYVFYHLLDELCRRWAPGVEHAALTVGLRGIASLDAAREIEGLGALLVADHARLADVTAGSGASRVLDRGGDPAAAFRALLARHGHRLLGRDLACPTWREAPDVVLGLAIRSAERARAAGATTGPGTLDVPAFAAAEQRRSAATARIEAAVARGAGGVARLRVFSATLAAAQRYYVVRENMRYYADFFLARLRTLALTLGARLVADGRLAAAADVCLLDLDELRRALDGVLPAELVDERRRELARDAVTPPPPVIDDRGSAPPARAAAADECAEITLRGDCVVPGRRRARARVVHDPGDFAAVADGDILVAAYTDPGWTPILELACGLVLDAGGQLSHGAIVARELGIPAVVNVAGATTVIRSGDTVELDATAGTVRVLRD